MTAIGGNTFPVRGALKALGGVWNKERKAWMVPDDKAEEAKRLVATPASAMAREAGKASYCRLGDGWGICCPETMPTEARMPGAHVMVLTKSGREREETLGAFIRKAPQGFIFAKAEGVGRPAKNGFAQGPRDPGEDAADRWAEGGVS